MMKRSHFSDGRYEYGFTSSGLFTIINKDGDSIYEISVPLLEKLGSHLVWIFFWITLILVSNLFCSESVVYITNRLFSGLIFVHLFLFGARLTTLLLKGGVIPIFFPPLWMRITRQFQKGAGEELLKKHVLEEHPGLLANLALAQLSRGEKEEAECLLNRTSTLLRKNQ